jgi:hypothetical protein
MAFAAEDYCGWKMPRELHGGLNLVVDPGWEIGEIELNSTDGDAQSPQRRGELRNFRRVRRTGQEIRIEQPNGDMARG